MTTLAATVRHVFWQSRHKPEMLLLLLLVGFVVQFSVLYLEDGSSRILQAFSKASHNRRNCSQGLSPACESPHTQFKNSSNLNTLFLIHDFIQNPSTRFQKSLWTTFLKICPRRIPWRIFLKNYFMHLFYIKELF